MMRRPLGPFHRVILAAALNWAAAVLGAEQAAPAERLDAFVESRHHPAIAYGRGPLDNAVAALNERLAAGQAALLEHQTQAANLITRAGWEARLGDPARTKAAAEALADYLLFVGEARIDEPIEGTSAFARAFQSRGPRDAMGRSLRDLQLDGRLMRYPLSYMVGTPMFDALPEEAAAIVRARLAAVLTGRDTSLRYAHLSAADRQAIIEILDATKPLLQIGR
jgi:hypothetical protein